MRIQFVVPPVDKSKFTGGIWCVMQYAYGLAERGHDVVIVPTTPGPQPTWIDGGTPRLSIKRASVSMYVTRCLLSTARSLVAAVFSTGKPRHIKRAVSTSLDALLAGLLRAIPFEYYRGASFRYLDQLLDRNADITICTHFETVLPTALYLDGKMAYFAQHYEPYFWRESRGGSLSEKEAQATYSLGVPIIANSSWLAREIQENFPRSDVEVCFNAIEQELFSPSSEKRVISHRIEVVSFGGRNLDWKGFDEMARAVSIARKKRPDLEIVWSVFGGAGLPPENSVASYRDLGFVAKHDLQSVYRKADLLLSASWYESFPLFPLEAMACGIATITTQLGTEDFARHEDTAEIVPARDAEAIADGILRLVEDDDYRKRLGENGSREAQKFTWSRSVDRFESIILKL